jgi:hypothetical protein
VRALLCFCIALRGLVGSTSYARDLDTDPGGGAQQSARSKSVINPVAIDGDDNEQHYQGRLISQQIVRAFADCVVKNRHAKVVALISDNTVYSLNEDFDVGRLADENCMAVATEGRDSFGVRFSGITFFNSIAEALVRRDFARTPVDRFADGSALTHWIAEEPDAQTMNSLKPKMRTRLAEGYQRVLLRRAVSIYGECVVRAVPDSVRALALVKPGSPMEVSMLRSIENKTQSCAALKPAHVDDPEYLRGSFLLNYARLRLADLNSAPSGKDAR